MAYPLKLMLSRHTIKEDISMEPPHTASEVLQKLVKVVQLPSYTMNKFLLVVVGLIALSSTASALYTHAQALALIQNAGIAISSSGGCSDRNNPTCTSLNQVRENTISQIVTLRSASACAITITGGTETGHASGTYSHWNGYKLDIRISTCIDNYVTTRFAFIGNRPGDGAPQYQSAAGNIYAKEGSHWDILYR